MPTGNDCSLSSTSSSPDTVATNGASATNGQKNCGTKMSTMSHDPTAYVARARVTRPEPPKPSYNPMQFVQIKPCNLFKSAQEQLKRAEEVKKVKEIKKEEPEEWQNNLDNWKSSRRKRVEHIIDRVVEVKKLELEEHDRARRKSTTFSEMLEKRGERRGINKLASLAVYNEDESNDLSDLGIGTSSASGKSSVSEDYDNQSVMSDNPDTEKHSDLEMSSNNENEELDRSKVYETNRDYISSPGYDTSSSSTAPASSPDPCEYTYEGAIQDYKTRVSRASSNGFRNSISSSSPYSKESTPERLLESRRGSKIEDRLLSFETSVTTTSTVKKDLPKVDITKRRELFETSSNQVTAPNNSQKRLSGDLGANKTIRERLSNLEKKPEDNFKAEKRLSGDITSIRERFSNLEKQERVPNFEKKPEENLSVDVSIRDRLLNLEKQEKIVEKVTVADISVPSLKDRLSSLQSAVTKEPETKKPVMLVDEHQLAIMKKEDEELLIKQQLALPQTNFDDDSNNSFNSSQEVLNMDTDREDSGIHTTDVSCSVSQTDEQAEIVNIEMDDGTTIQPNEDGVEEEVEEDVITEPVTDLEISVSDTPSSSSQTVIFDEDNDGDGHDHDKLVISSSNSRNCNLLTSGAFNHDNNNIVVGVRGSKLTAKESLRGSRLKHFLLENCENKDKMSAISESSSPPISACSPVEEKSVVLECEIEPKTTSLVDNISSQPQFNNNIESKIIKPSSSTLVVSVTPYSAGNTFQLENKAEPLTTFSADTMFSQPQLNIEVENQPAKKIVAPSSPALVISVTPYSANNTYQQTRTNIENDKESLLVKDSVAPLKSLETLKNISSPILVDDASSLQQTNFDLDESVNIESLIIKNEKKSPKINFPSSGSNVFSHQQKYGDKENATNIDSLIIKSQPKNLDSVQQNLQTPSLHQQVNVSSLVNSVESAGIAENEKQSSQNILTSEFLEKIRAEIKDGSYSFSAEKDLSSGKNSTSAKCISSDELVTKERDDLELQKKCCSQPSSKEPISVAENATPTIKATIPNGRVEIFNSKQIEINKDISHIPNTASPTDIFSDIAAQTLNDIIADCQGQSKLKSTNVGSISPNSLAYDRQVTVEEIPCNKLNVNDYPEPHIIITPFAEVCLEDIRRCDGGQNVANEKDCDKIDVTVNPEPPTSYCTVSSSDIEKCERVKPSKIPISSFLYGPNGVRSPVGSPKSEKKDITPPKINLTTHPTASQMTSSPPSSLLINKKTHPTASQIPSPTSSGGTSSPLTSPKSQRKENFLIGRLKSVETKLKVTPSNENVDMEPLATPPTSPKTNRKSSPTSKPRNIFDFIRRNFHSSSAAAPPETEGEDCGAVSINNSTFYVPMEVGSDPKNMVNIEITKTIKTEKIVEHSDSLDEDRNTDICDEINQMLDEEISKLNSAGDQV